MAAPTTDPARMSVAELEQLATAPDLTKRERRELARAIRFQRRVETWEGRLQGPQPRKLHRAIITIVMMLLCLFVLYLVVSGPPG